MLSVGMQSSMLNSIVGTGAFFVCGRSLGASTSGPVHAEEGSYRV